MVRICHKKIHENSDKNKKKSLYKDNRNSQKNLFTEKKIFVQEMCPSHSAVWEVLLNASRLSISETVECLIL